MSLRQMLDGATARERQNIEQFLRRTYNQYHPKPEQAQARQEQKNESSDIQSKERR